MKRIICLFFLLGMGYVATAQYYYDKLYSLSLDVNQPMSNTSFLNSTSVNGGKLGYRSFINERVAIGLGFNWANYKQHEPRQTYPTPTGAITAEYFKDVFLFGLALEGAYYLHPDKQLTPYFGLGVGASNVDYNRYYNIYSDGENAWGVLIRPEVGVFYRVGQNASWGFQAAAHFDYSSAAGKSLNYSNFTNLGLSIGVVYLDW